MTRNRQYAIQINDYGGGGGGGGGDGVGGGGGGGDGVGGACGGVGGCGGGSGGDGGGCAAGSGVVRGGGDVGACGAVVLVVVVVMEVGVGVASNRNDRHWFDLCITCNAFPIGSEVRVVYQGTSPTSKPFFFFSLSQKQCWDKIYSDLLVDVSVLLSRKQNKRNLPAKNMKRSRDIRL